MVYLLYLLDINHLLLSAPYAANLILEVWQNLETSSVVVRAQYNGQVLETAWCDFESCNMDDFTSHFESYIPRDLDQECRRV